MGEKSYADWIDETLQWVLTSEELAGELESKRMIARTLAMSIYVRESIREAITQDNGKTAEVRINDICKILSMDLFYD